TISMLRRPGPGVPATSTSRCGHVCDANRALKLLRIAQVFMRQSSHCTSWTDAKGIDVIFVEEEDEHVNPIGVKGIGEIRTTGVAAAIANAVYHATSVVA